MGRKRKCTGTIAELIDSSSTLASQALQLAPPKRTGAASSTGKSFYFSATIDSISLKGLAKPLHLSTNCSNKVSSSSKHTRTDPEHCYNFSLQASDSKDTIQIQCIDPVGYELFRATASEMVKLQSADKAAFNRRIDRAVSKKRTFLCKACTVDFSGKFIFTLAINASLDA